MGINICLRLDGEDHDGWDWFRYVNDRYFPGLLDTIKAVANPLNSEECRPCNLDSLRSVINDTGWDNTDRYLNLVDLLESDPDCYIYISW